MTTTDSHTSAERTHALTRSLPQPLAERKFEALELAVSFHSTAIRLVAAARELAVGAEEHYGDDTFDELSLAATGKLFDLDGTDLLACILTETEMILAKNFGMREAADLDLTPESCWREHIAGLAAGPLGEAAKV